jgi:hypothetical protein
VLSDRCHSYPENARAITDTLGDAYPSFQADDSDVDVSAQGDLSLEADSRVRHPPICLVQRRGRIQRDCMAFRYAFLFLLEPSNSVQNVSYGSVHHVR